MRGLYPRAQRDAAFILMFAFVVGTLVSLTPYHSDLNPDTIMVYLVSLVKWTPYFWGQDRYGMLIPALTTWITDPVVNVVVQNAMHVFGAVVAFFLLARTLFPRSRWKLVALWAITLHAALSGAGDLMNFYVPWQIYTTALSLGLCAMLAAEDNLTAAFGLVALAEWVNFSVFLLTGPIALARALTLMRRDGRGVAGSYLLRQILVLVFGVVAGEVLRRTLAPGGGGYEPLPFAEAITGGWRILAEAATSPRSNPALFAVPPILGVIGWARWGRGRASSRLGISELVSAQVVALAYVMVVGASAFAKGNGYPRRYAIPALMIWVIAWAAVLVERTPLGQPRPGRRALAVAAVLVTLIWRLGWPSVNAVRPALARVLEPGYATVAPECTHLVGDYYRVWPAFFQARIVGRPLWAISYRSEVTVEFWNPRRFPAPVLCYWRDDEPQAFKFLNAVSSLRGFARAEERGDMILLRRP